MNDFVFLGGLFVAVYISSGFVCASVIKESCKNFWIAVLLSPIILAISPIVYVVISIIDAFLKDDDDE